MNADFTTSFQRAPRRAWLLEPRGGPLKTRENVPRILDIGGSFIEDAKAQRTTTEFSVNETYGTKAATNAKKSELCQRFFVQCLQRNQKSGIRLELD